MTRRGRRRTSARRSDAKSETEKRKKSQPPSTPLPSKKSVKNVESSISPKRKSNKHKTIADSPAIPKKKQQKHISDSSSEDDTHNSTHAIPSVSNIEPSESSGSIITTTVIAPITSSVESSYSSTTQSLASATNLLPSSVLSKAITPASNVVSLESITNQDPIITAVVSTSNPISIESPRLLNRQGLVSVSTLLSSRVSSQTSQSSDTNTLEQMCGIFGMHVSGSDMNLTDQQIAEKNLNDYMGRMREINIRRLARQKELESMSGSENSLASVGPTANQASSVDMVLGPNVNSGAGTSGTSSQPLHDQTPNIFEILEGIEADESQNPDFDLETNTERNQEEPVIVQVQQKKQYHEWTLEKKFANAESCLVFIKSEDCWAYLKTVNTKHGIKTYYRCNKTKHRGKKCAAQIYTRHDQYPGDISYDLYRKVAEHDHETSENMPKKISAEIENFIKDCIIDNKTLVKITQLIRKNAEFEQPTQTMIASTIKRIRKELFGNSKVLLEDFIKFCQENNAIPDDDDKAFVLGFEHTPLNTMENTEIIRFVGENDITTADPEINSNINAIPLEDEGDEDEETQDDEGNQIQRTGRITENIESNPEMEEEMYFRFIVTTKRLLKNSINSKIIHADATHKMLIQKYPVLVFGTTDQDSQQHFHLVGIMVSKHETSKDFEFGFRAIKDGMQRVQPDIAFDPNVCMADAAGAIANGFTRVFPNDPVILMCFAHVIRAIDRQKLNNPTNKKGIKNDLRILKRSYDKKTFDEGCKLFLAKWENAEPDFVTYFNTYWIKRNQNWYDGAHLRTPSTNNGLEGFNGNLKIYDTYYKRHGLAEFKFRLLELVENRSRKYISDKHLFKTDVTISKTALKEGERLSTIKNYILRKSDDGEKAHCYLKGGDKIQPPLTKDDVIEYLQSKPDTFTDFSQNLHKLYCVTFAKDSSDWKKATCTCPSFMDHFMCKHIVFIAYKLKLLPNKTKQVIESNAKGRPRKGTGALTRD